MNDLFGVPITEPLSLATGVPKKRKLTKANGYAGLPGSGPEGETCKTCAFLVRRGGCTRIYLKCGKNRCRWTNGPGSDIKAGSPACQFWVKQEPK